MLLRKNEEKRASPKTGNNSRQSSLRKGMSYAAAAGIALTSGTKSGHGTPRVQTTNVTMQAAVTNFEKIDKDCHYFFEGGLLNCLDKIGGFAIEYGRLKGGEPRSSDIMGMLMAIGQHAASS